MANLVKDMEQKIANLEAELKKHSNYATEITQAIEKLNQDKANSINNVNIINGAIQAYKDVLNGAKAESATVVDDSVLEEGNG